MTGDLSGGQFFHWPADELDEPDQLLALLGAFWSETYAGQDLVRSVLAAAAQLEIQADLDFQALLDSISRFKVRVTQTQIWLPLVLLKSQLNQTPANLLRFDGGQTFDSGYVFDQFLPGQLFSYPAPTDLLDVGLISNRITSASINWLPGFDFQLSPGAISFRRDPFKTPGFVAEPVFANGEAVDEQLTVWLCRAALERETIYEQFGFLLGVKLPSSPNYRDYVNACYDLMVQGPSRLALRRAVAAVCDVPLIQEAQETVTATFVEDDKQWVVTDQHAYSLSSASTLTVAIGDTLSQGDTLDDTLIFYEFEQGQLPSDLQALALGEGLRAEGFFQDLVFQNKVVPLVVDTDEQGFTKVSFEIGGLPADVEAFWDRVHAAGLAQGKTLANLLDTRPAPQTTQPQAFNLPATVNPLGFLLSNLWRDNLEVISCQTRQFGPQALGFHLLQLVRRLLPPHMSLLYVAQLESGPDPIIMDGPGTDTQAGYTEDVSTFFGNTISDPIDLSYFGREALQARYIAGQLS